MQTHQRPILTIRIPTRFRDDLPLAPPYIPAAEDLDEELGSPSPLDSVENKSWAAFQTEPDSYGVFRKYTCGKPTITPDHLCILHFRRFQHLISCFEFIPWLDCSNFLSS